MNKLLRFAISIGFVCISVLLILNLPPLPYYREYRACEEDLSQLLNEQPQNVSAETWEVASGWAMIAYANVFFSPEHAPIEKLEEFHTNIKRLSGEEIGLPTIDWIWQQFSDSGTHGQRYCQRFEPQYREALNLSLAKQQ